MNKNMLVNPMGKKVQCAAQSHAFIIWKPNRKD